MRASDEKNGFLQIGVPMCFEKRLWFSRALVGCLFVTLCVAQFATAQTTPAWTWMGGSNTIYQPGNYGTLGTPAPGNIPPGRWNAVTRTDKSGNLWLFGGQGYDAATNATGILLNDLWEFSPSLNEWTWMGGSSALPKSANGLPGVYGTLGVAATGNSPGSRDGAATWVDTNGNFWLFGGTGCDATGNIGGLKTSGSTALRQTNGPGWEAAVQWAQTARAPESMERWECLPLETSLGAAREQ